MAAVYEAQNVDIGKRVAVKVLNPELTHSTVVVERFLREARAAAAVNSPYICDVYDAGKLDDGRPFLVLELLEGESLYEQMIKVRRFDVHVVVRIFGQIAKGLTKAHDANIIHRDLKPENIFLTTSDDGEVVAKILDFGLAKFYEPIGANKAQQRLTREGAIFGTPAYMSPEQVKGQGAVDSRADLWALGCMVYECLTGRTVWTTDQGVAMIFAQVATAQLPRPTKLRPDLPPTFDKWFLKALDRDPNKRFQSAKELAEELAIALMVTNPRGVLSIPEAPPPPPPPPGTPAPAPAPAAAPAPSGSGSKPKDSDNSAEPMAFAPTQPPPPLSAIEPMEAADVPSKSAVEPTPSMDATAATVKPELRATAESLPRRRNNSIAWTLGGAAVVIVAGVLSWRFLVRPATTGLPTALTASGSSSALGSASGRSDAPPSSSAHLPKWAATVLVAQEQLSKGETEPALKSFKEAADTGGAGVTRLLLEQATIAAGGKGPCKTVSIGRPRPFELTGNTRRSTVAMTQRGPVVAWTDDHEVAGQWHAYSMLLDSAMRSAGAPIDVTPEAVGVQDPRLFVADDRLILMYGDAAGATPGIFLRVLDSTGRITAPPVRVSESRAAVQSPSIARGPIGDFWLAFIDERDKTSDDVFLQKLSPSLRPAQPVIRISDLVGKGIAKTKARMPSIAIASSNIQIVYRVEDARDHSIMRQKIALNDPGLVTGLPDLKDKHPTKDRVVGELKPVTDKKIGGVWPTITCDTSGCLIAWRDDPKGASAAFFDPNSSTIIWRKKFSAAATQVNVMLDGSGRGLLAWYEAGRLKVASITKDGMGEAGLAGRVLGDQPRPELAPGAQGEWLITWNDLEAQHMETYVARVSCR
ncbi:MAG: serine/threonine protein kinase [Deltaproteobacteria bacterium]|nr:serine/threonine protein kinase [Deltaproteobacteria bacterium]